MSNSSILVLMFNYLIILIKLMTIKNNSGTSASFGVNCDMPGLHFPDTCVTDLGNVFIILHN